MLNNEEVEAIREQTNMKLFCFYLDDITKLNVLKKLRELGIDCAKGSLSATIRALLSMFASTDDVPVALVESIKNEYILSTKKNKRSRL